MLFLQHREKLVAATLGDGKIDPWEWRHYSDQDANVATAYGDQGLSVTVWSLRPGQENQTHLHPASDHLFQFLEGEGIYLRGDPEKPDYREIPVKAGEYLVIPRQTLHGIRNTGRADLSYLGITTIDPEFGYQWIFLEDVRRAGGGPIDPTSELARRNQYGGKGSLREVK